MDEKLTQFITDLQKFSLTESEFTAIKMRLTDYADFHIVRIPSSDRLSVSEGSWFYKFVTSKKYMNMKIYIAAAILVALVVGAGTSFAAEKSLPGDILYPIKVNITENIKGAFTFGTKAKAEWNAQRAFRRLEEVERLAAQGKFDRNARTEVESHFEKHIQDFREYAGQDAVASSSMELYAGLEKTLYAHENVLTQVHDAGGQKTNEIKNILLEVKKETDKLTKERITKEIQGQLKDIITSGKAKTGTTTNIHNQDASSSINIKNIKINQISSPQNKLLKKQ